MDCNVAILGTCANETVCAGGVGAGGWRGRDVGDSGKREETAGSSDRSAPQLRGSHADPSAHLHLRAVAPAFCTAGRLEGVLPLPSLAVINVICCR